MRAGNIAVIGGTGFNTLPPEIFAEPILCTTRFGTAKLLSVSYNYVEPFKLYFLARHGEAHDLAPHQINYRANIAALVELGVTSVFATNAVGSLRTDIPPGSLVLLDDFVDFTRARPLSYFAAGEAWNHTDFSTPYSRELRSAIQRGAEEMNIGVIPRGTYLCCDGPRFESPAEIRVFASWGADVVGMTGLPEAIFAREAGLPYAALAIVTNLGAGLTGTAISHEQVKAAMATWITPAREILMRAAAIVANPDSLTPD